MGGPHDELRFLADSDNRLAVLERLTETDALDRYDLEDTLDASRRTVVRTLGAFDRRGYLTAADTADAYVPTGYGVYLGQLVAEFEADLAAAIRLRPLLEQLEADELGFDPRHLADADLTVASDVCPYAAFDRFLEMRTEAGSVRFLAPKIERRSLNQVVRRLDDEPDFEAEVIITEPVESSMQAHQSFRAAYETMLDADRVDVYRYSETIPYMLAALDDRVAIGVSRDEQPYAIVETDEPTVVEWVRGRLDDYLAASEPIDD